MVTRKICGVTRLAKSKEKKVRIRWLNVILLSALLVVGFVSGSLAERGRAPVCQDCTQQEKHAFEQALATFRCEADYDALRDDLVYCKSRRGEWCVSHCTGEVVPDE